MGLPQGCDSSEGWPDKASASSVTWSLSKYSIHIEFESRAGEMAHCLRVFVTIAGFGFDSQQPHDSFSHL